MQRKYVLNQSRIDSINNIDVSKLTFDDIYVHYRTGQAYIVAKNHEKVSKYRTGIGTNIGDIEISVWREIIKQMIVIHQETNLYENLTTFFKEKTEIKNRDETEQYILECYSFRLFDDPQWRYYIEFNQQHRPESLLKEQTI